MITRWGSRWALLLVVLGLLVAGPVLARISAAERPTLLGAHNDTSTPFNLVSIPALIHHRYDGRELRLTRVLERRPGYTRYAVAYRSGDLVVAGVMNVPAEPGPHPVVVLAHGWARPASYRTGSMLEAEQAYLAERGFVAFQIDYRNYGGSSRETPATVARPLGYPEDLINAVRALHAARLPFADLDRVAVLGRSMGGGVALNALVARPGVFDAAVLYSPVSSSAADGYRRWVAPREPLRTRVTAAYGSPRSNPGLWRTASARSYLDRVDVPVLIAHGTADLTCPVAWSEATARALHAAGKDVTLREYDGEGHRFEKAWPAFMRQSVAFLRARLAPGTAAALQSRS